REQAFLGALETLATEALTRGDQLAAERYLRRAVAVDPLRESAQRALMQALATGGNFAAASQVYRDLRLRLHHEINARPDPETEALFDRLRTEAFSPPRNAPAPGTGDRHASPPAAPHNLPEPVTGFIGREREKAEVCSLLAATRLLTLT